MHSPGDASGTQYVTGSVKTDDVVKTVMATGTLVPALNIEVGSVLSGQVSKLLVDFNDRVKKGQVLAELDDKTYVLTADAARAAVQGAQSDIKSHEARLKRATFDLWQAEHQLPVFTARVNAAQTMLDTAEREFKRKQWLQEQQVAAPMDVQNAQARRDTAASSLQEAQANLANQTGLISAAKADLDRTIADLDSAKAAAGRLEAQWRNTMVDVDRTKIRSPVDGVVVGRNITEGQTLATGLEAKTLFVIAGDLGHMEINARINESDIAAIRDSQDASFTVDAFPGRTFAAKVKQIRMAPQVLSNVVTYTVVLKTPNPDGILLPGMTVMANIVTDRTPARPPFRSRRCATTPPWSPRRRAVPRRSRCGCCGTARPSHFPSPRARKTAGMSRYHRTAFVQPMLSSLVRKTVDPAAQPTTSHADRASERGALLSPGGEGRSGTAGNVPDAAAR